MTWTLSEAQEQEHREAHGFEVGLQCPYPGCGHTWVAHTIYDDEIPDDQRCCEHCGTAGEEL